MSKVECTSLVHFWDNMSNTQRDIVIRQVIDILLELSTLRLDNIGSLFESGGGSWCIEPFPENDDVPQRTYTSGTVQFLAIANVSLHKILHNRFGYIGNEFDYPRHWFMRPLIPSFYDDALDVKGFPPMHGDFHSQSIFIIDVDTRPRITTVIDWDNTGTTATTFFAQYPLFIVDHLA